MYGKVIRVAYLPLSNHGTAALMQAEILWYRLRCFALKDTQAKHK